LTSRFFKMHDPGLHNKQQVNSGYTLIELTIIIILIGIIFLFAFPRLDNIGDTKLRSSARKLAGTIQSLFDEAVLKKETYQLIIDIRERSYSVVKSVIKGEDFDLIDMAKDRTNLPDRVYIKDVIIPLDGKVSEGMVTISFYSDGFVDNNVIHLSDGKKDYTLVTTPLTGKVKVLEGYIEILEEE